ncbi:hypothetical protein LPJ66_000764 [Kickxella alabastrina]|uniref:Uncharacterized protein n=1 Tax=Kickxella alabastrina TaxID=61397 RepID=A0ACC1IV90_9FUNG|nr:hypothetical protein LPJ66_000764 [Kickxella alabastrina]
MYKHKDEGLDDCRLPLAAMPSPPQSSSLTLFSKLILAVSVNPDRLPIASAEWQAMESLAFTLRSSVNPQFCAQLAIMLLSNVPTDMLNSATHQLSMLLRRDFIGGLPVEISTRILEFVPASDIARNVSLVNRRWHAVATQPCLWRRMFYRRGWAVDKKRWDFYCSIPQGLSATTILRDSAVFQTSRAIALAASFTGPHDLADTGTLTTAAIEAQLADTSWAMALGTSRLPAWEPQQIAIAKAKDHALRASRSTLASLGMASANQQHLFESASMMPLLVSSLPEPFSLALPLLPVPSLRNFQGAALTRSQKQTNMHYQEDRPIHWRKVYSEYHLLLGNWRSGRCRVDRWESAHSEGVYCLQFDRYNRLFTGSKDHSVKLWHLSEVGGQLTQLATLRGHTGSVLTLQAESNMLITGSSDASVCVWDTKTLLIRQRLAHPSAVLSLRFNNRWLATACKDSMLRVWQRDNCGFINLIELRGHAIAVNAIHLHNDKLVSASGDRTIRVWDLNTRSCVLTLVEHTRGVACLDFDGKYIVSGSSDRTIRIWNAETGACERTIDNAHGDLVRTVMFDRSMNMVVSGSYDRSIKIWQFSTGALIHKINNVHTSHVLKLMLDKSRIVSCSHDCSISIIDFAAELSHARLLL